MSLAYSSTDYQAFVKRCLRDREQNISRNCSVERLLFEMTGELGELINAYKHDVLWIREAHIEPEITDNVIDEAGDLLWYLTAVINQLGLSLDEVMQRNTNKLTERYGDRLENSRADERRS